MFKNKRDLERENKKLKQKVQWMSRDLKQRPLEIKEWFVNNDQEAEWIEFAKDFELCEHCGFDETGGSGDYHHEYTDRCPEAFRQMCDDFIDETGNGNSTRCLIRMLHEEITDKGDERILQWVDYYHHQKVESWYPELEEKWGEPEPEIDFNKWLEQEAAEGNTPENLLWDYLWTYEQNREILNEWITEFWIEDFEEETGLKV